MTTVQTSKAAHITRPLKISDFIEAHSDDFTLEDGQLTIREGAEHTLNNTLRSLFTSRDVLIAGATKTAAIIPGYHYTLSGGEKNSITLRSINELGTEVRVTLVDFLNAFCDNLIPISE